MKKKMKSPLKRGADTKCGVCSPNSVLWPTHPPASQWAPLFRGDLILLLIIILATPAFAEEIPTQVTEINQPEVKDESHSQVIIREHPKTGKSYVTIVSSDIPVPPDPFTNRDHYSRPDYRMLDPKMKKGDYVYDGPYSDRKKVYIFAASMIAIGVTGGVAGMALAPAATGTAASAGGGGAYLIGAGVATGVGGVAAADALKVKAEDENFIHEGESKSIQTPKEQE